MYYSDGCNSDDEPSSHKSCQEIVEKGNHSMGDMLLESGRRVPRRLACMHARIKRHHEGASDVQSHFGFPMTDVAQFASTGQILRSQTYYRAVPRRARPVGSHSVCLGAFSIGGTRGRRATAPQSLPGPPSERADLAVPQSIGGGRPPPPPWQGCCLIKHVNKNPIIFIVVKRFPLKVHESIGLLLGK